MTLNRFSRTELIYGADAMKRLAECRVAVFGIGGVGGYVIEYLARIGVGHITAADGDVFQPSNLNRQLLSTEANLGENKAAAGKARVSGQPPGKADMRQGCAGGGRALRSRSHRWLERPRPYRASRRRDDGMALRLQWRRGGAYGEPAVHGSGLRRSGGSRGGEAPAGDR